MMANSSMRICVAAGNGHRVSEIETGIDLTITPKAEIRHRQRERAPLVAYFCPQDLFHQIARQNHLALSVLRKIAGDKNLF